MATQIILAQDQGVFYKSAARIVLEAAIDAIERNGSFSLVLSGGDTPKKLYALLADSYYSGRINWTMTHVFWGDERCVPPNHDDSNYKMAHEALLSKIPIPESQVHRIMGEMASSIEAARAYELNLKIYFQSMRQKNPLVSNQVDTIVGDFFPKFDLVLLGVGGDGHTASLFPGNLALKEKRHWAVGTYVEQVSGQRVTLTFPVINNARKVVILCQGESKSAIVREIFQRDEESGSFPVQLVRPDPGELVWLLDRSAGVKLPPEIRYNAVHI